MVEARGGRIPIGLGHWRVGAREKQELRGQESVRRPRGQEIKGPGSQNGQLVIKE